MFETFNFKSKISKFKLPHYYYMMIGETVFIILPGHNLLRNILLIFFTL